MSDFQPPPMSDEEFEALMNDPKFTNSMNDMSTLPDAPVKHRYVDLTPNVNANEDIAFLAQMGVEQQPAPMPMPVPTPIAAHTPQMPPPIPVNPVPMTAFGPSFDPRIGWYYPAVAGNGATPYGMPQAGYASAYSSTPMSTKPKRKYGPAQFLEERARDSAATAMYTSQASSGNDRAKAEKNGDKYVGARLKKNQPSVVQACVCNDKETLKIKRPRNAFIIYRSQKSEKIMKDLGKKDNQKVSSLAGQAWKAESEEVKAHYHRLAAEEAARHKRMYPNYHYQPGQTSKIRFGSQSCKCGAYQVNITNLRNANQDGQADEADETDVEDVYDPAAGYQQQRQQQYQAPTAPMAPAVAGPSKRKRQATVALDLEDEIVEQPISKRTRSSPPVAFQQPQEFGDPLAGLFHGDLFQNAYDPNAFAPDSGLNQRRRPSPIHTVGGNAAALETTPHPQAFAVGDSTARNTRSKSRASQELEDAFNAYQHTTYPGGYGPGIYQEGEEFVDFDMFGADLTGAETFDFGNEFDVPAPVEHGRRRSSRISPRSAITPHNR
ncbi:uncharacterized protein LTR77_008169 [Saxophila tyrrhenica]|uniref:HMG box domain-containing protein n=1 Tax=Saxophila tyrrhenica TaxID=1690608 RepID=A0AAV9P1Z7_9PEZI|nr:hypothetical protein LTR77_008169 [Saxophila tyrrhenica]